MSKDKPETAEQGEILSPSSGGIVRDSRRPMIVSAFSRVRNQVMKKELDSFAAKARAWNEVVTALRDGERLRQEYQAAFIRSEHLPLLRAAEEEKVLAEVQKIFDDESDRQLERKVRRTHAEAELIRAERDLDALKNPRSPKADESRGKQRIAAIKRLREERDEMIAIIQEGRTEDQLSEEDRQIIQDIRLAADHQIKSLLEEGSA